MKGKGETSVKGEGKMGKSVIFSYVTFPSLYSSPKIKRKAKITPVCETSQF